MIYIAGPYSADSAWQREKNIRAAEEACCALWKAGIAAICVHTMSRYFYGEVPEDIAVGIDNEILELCDGILLVGDWEKSKGTLGELDLAQSLRLEIYYTVEDIIAQRDAFLKEEGQPWP